MVKFISSTTPSSNNPGGGKAATSASIYNTYLLEGSLASIALSEEAERQGIPFVLSQGS
jgi:hypothetical protein